MENFLNSTLHLAALHIQVWGVLLNIFYLIFLSVLHQMETFPRLAADYSNNCIEGGSGRDNVSPPKSTTGLPGLSSSGLPDYLSDVETNPGGRMYRTESGRIYFFIEIV